VTDPHGRFESWLAEATPGDPPRDLALHASTCAECLARAASVDALAAVDPGMAPMPSLHVRRAPRRAGAAPIARAVAGVAAVGLLGTAVLIGTGALLAGRFPAGDGIAGASRSPDEGVLSVAGGRDPTPTVEPTATPSATPSVSPHADDSPDPTAPLEASAAAVPAPAPAPPAATPRPVTPPPPATTPRPTPTPTPRPPTPPPTATQAPTPPPTPEPTPAPTPTPTSETTP
jgi:hypothetical protein